MTTDIQNQITVLFSRTGMSFLFQMVAGSRRFGFSTESSDYDIRIIGMPTVEYFKPHLRGLVIGYDRALVPNMSTISNIVDTSGNTRVKYDIFIDALPQYISYAVSGGYFQLQNLMSPLDDMTQYDDRWVSFRETLVNVLPTESFVLAAMHLIRDMKEIEVRLEKNAYKTEQEQAKKVVQVLFISEFIQTRDPLNQKHDYLTMRNTGMSKENCLSILSNIKTSLWGYVESATATAKGFKAERDAFSTTLQKGINTWFNEEIFPIP